MLYQIEAICPYWALGILLGSFIISFLRCKIEAVALRISGGRYVIFKMLSASLLGALSPITLHGMVPLIVTMGLSGVPQHILASFIVTSVLINPNLFIFSLALGVPMAVMRLLLSVTAGMLAGALAMLLTGKRPMFNFEAYSIEKNKDNHKGSAFSVFVKNIKRSAVRTGGNLMIGMILTALFDKFFPRELFYSVFSNNRGLGVLFSASLGVPIYFCGGGTIPLVRAWMDQGMGMGSAAAFMITGPATKVNNLTAVKSITKGRGLALYLVFNIAFGILSGLLIDIIWSL